MAEILALGISHYPPLSTSDAKMAQILKNMLRNPALPEAMRDPANWPAEARAQWGNDDGATAAAGHRADLVAWMHRVRAELDAFKPDFVLMWGDDQYENFKEDVVPPYCVYAHPEFNVGPRHVDNVWGEALEHNFNFTGHPVAGKALAAALINEGFDTAYSYKPLHHPLGHAFLNGLLYLDYDRTGFAHPILPMSINCYGRKVIAQRGGQPRFDRTLTDADLDPPAPTPRRLFDLGAATARFLAQSPWRVAILASSGWSHAFLTPKTQFLWPDTGADRQLYDALLRQDYAAWRDYPASAVEESGQQEVLNWMCLVGALSELQRTPRETAFVDTWIFNSSKVFLIAPPN